MKAIDILGLSDEKLALKCADFKIFYDSDAVTCMEEIYKYRDYISEHFTHEELTFIALTWLAEKSTRIDEAREVIERFGLDKR